MLRFNATHKEFMTIVSIATRACEVAAEADIEYEQRDAIMDIEACHCNGCPLDLNKLLKADSFTFKHDVFGIRRFIDRSTGKLTGCFVPRCADGVLTKS